MKTPNTPSPNPTASQQIDLYNHVMTGKRITGLQAITLYGCIGYSQRFGELKQHGIPIQSQFIKLPNGKRVKEYWLDPSYIQSMEATA